MPLGGWEEARCRRVFPHTPLAFLRATEDKVRSFISYDEDLALKQAAEVDARIAKGEALGPLAGVPLAIKDNISTRGMQTTAGSKILQGKRPLCPRSPDPAPLSTSSPPRCNLLARRLRAALRRDRLRPTP